MYCKIKKDGVYSEFINDNEDGFVWRKVPFLSYHLMDVVEHDEDVTVGDLIHILMDYEHEVDHLFLSSSGGFELRPFFEDLDNTSDGGAFDELVFTWNAVVIEDEDDDLNIQKTLEEDRSILGKKDRFHYGLMFCPMGDLKYSRIRLDTTYRLFSKEGNNVVINCNKPFTLRDIVEPLFFEMTFCGYPDNRDKKAQELKKDVDPRKGVEHGQGKVLLPEEIELEREEEKLKRLEQKEKYEEAKVVKDRVEGLKEKILSQKGSIDRFFEDG